MKRSPLKRKPPPGIPQETRLAVWDRSLRCCEWCGAGWGEVALQLAHIKHRQMGGRHGKWFWIIHAPRNVALLCVHCHDTLDLRNFDKELSTTIRDGLKKKLDWDSWDEEYHEALLSR